MKKFALVLFCMPLSAASAAAVDESLEPCINGGVSATGKYASQELEDARRYALEADIDEGASGAGSYADQRKGRLQ